MAESAGQNLPSTSRQSFQERMYLNTHMWHENYFHMIHKWRYEIPNYSLKKDLTVSYRAITQGCLLQDISYYTCIEIVGKKNVLKTTLKRHCNPKETFAAKMYINGQREGTVMFFKKNGYPQFPIGNVNFFWKRSETNIKTIWIWIHPAFYSDFLSEIISSFEFKQNNREQVRSDTSYNLNDLHTNDAGCEMRVLKFALNRFRLYGPAALTALKNTLRTPSLTKLDLDSKNCPMTEEQDSSLSDEKLDTSSDSNVSMKLVKKMVIHENETDTKDSTIHDPKKKIWHTKYYKKRENIEAFKIQELMWVLMKVLGLPQFLPSNMIIGLTVLDPRFNSEKFRKKSRLEIPSSAETLRSHLPSDLNRSPIWDAQIRHIVNTFFVSTQTIKKFIGELRMSNNPNFNEDVMAKIPILLVQKSAGTSLGSSIDIIMPSRWAISFWIELLKQSVAVLVGGLRETELVVLESLRTNVPDIIDPDTPAYMREALTRKEELTNEYFSHLPTQRVNFIEFGIRSPFFCDWKNLTRGWSGVEDFYVLRDFRLLALLRNEIETIERKNASSKSTVEESKFDFEDFDEYQNCLVQVKLSMVDKGTPREFAIICTPTLKDLGRFEDNKNYDGPVEKPHSDPNKTSRKILRKVHPIELELLRRKLSRHRVKRKRTSKDNVLPGEFDVFEDEISRAEHQKMLSDHERQMRKFYLPKSTEVRHSCDREVMGYVTMGGYSFQHGEGGIGYVTLPSLLKIIRKESDIVLVRNTVELQYRFARLGILTDINRRHKFRISGQFFPPQVHGSGWASRKTVSSMIYAGLGMTSKRTPSRRKIIYIYV